MKNADVSRNERVCNVIYLFFGSFLGKVSVKFHHCSICVTDFRKGGPRPIQIFSTPPPFPHLWEALKRAILNKVKASKRLF